MTLPDERLRALRMARELIAALIVPSETPRVPMDVRRWASRVLKHYPLPLELDALGKHPLLREDCKPWYAGMGEANPRSKRR